jgi:hypothetical protein
LPYFSPQPSIHLDSPSQRPYTNKRRSVCANAALKDQTAGARHGEESQKRNKAPKKGQVGIKNEKGAATAAPFIVPSSSLPNSVPSASSVVNPSSYRADGTSPE